MNATRCLRLALLGAAAALGLSCGERSPLGVNPGASRPQAALVDSLVGILSQHTGLLQCSPLAPDSVTQTIGPDGGTLQVGPHTLSIPPGALTELVTITAVVPSDTVNRVEFQPQGLTFQQPASLAMSYANCTRTDAVKRIAYTSDALEILEWVPSVDDASAQTATGQVSHFSDYAIAW